MSSETDDRRESGEVPVTPPQGIAIRAQDLGKCYLMYEQPSHRLWQMLWRNRRRFYREFWALSGVSLEVRRGESFGIIGANGAGKSTLLQMICGTLNPSSGSIAVNGRVAALLELGAGFNPEFTGRENVYLSASLHGLSNAQIDERFDRISAFAEIGEFMAHPVKTYSSGMFVRLAFAVIAHVDADILVIDEALSVGDVFFTQRCMRFLRRFRETGTLVLVSHDTGAILGLCDRGAWLENGRLRATGSAKEVVDAYHRAAIERIAAAGLAPPRPDEPPSGSQSQTAPDAGSDLPVAAAAAQSAPANLATMFDAHAESFGLRGAEIVDVYLEDPDGRRIAAVQGGERVRFHVVIQAHREIERAVAGCYVRDRLGQLLFGDTTEKWQQERRLSLVAGQRIDVVFDYLLPLLPRGSYALTVAIAEGTVAEHVHHHYFNEALTFECNTPENRYGLVGLLPRDVRWTTLETPVTPGVPAPDAPPGHDAAPAPQQPPKSVTHVE